MRRYRANRRYRSSNSGENLISQLTASILASGRVLLAWSINPALKVLAQRLREGPVDGETLFRRRVVTDDRIRKQALR